MLLLPGLPLERHPWLALQDVTAHRAAHTCTWCNQSTLSHCAVSKGHTYKKRQKPSHNSYMQENASERFSLAMNK